MRWLFIGRPGLGLGLKTAQSLTHALDLELQKLNFFLLLHHDLIE